MFIYVGLFVSICFVCGCAFSLVSLACRSTLIVEYKVFWIKKGKKSAEPLQLPAGISLNCNDTKGFWLGGNS